MSEKVVEKKIVETKSDKTKKFLKKLGSKTKKGLSFLYDKTKVVLTGIYDGLIDLKERIKNRQRPDIFVLISRIFVGFGYGIYAGIKDAGNSWKYDRGTIDDYEIEIDSLPFV